MFRSALYVLAILFSMLPMAWAGNLSLALSDGSGPYAEFATALEESLDKTSWKIRESGKAEEIDLAGTHSDMIIAAGSEAFRKVLLRGGSTPVIATLVTRQSYEKILAESGKGRPRVTAIYLDQPPARQASFLRHLLPGRKRIGMLLSQETRPQASQYRLALNNAGLNLESEDTDSDNTLLPAINALLPRVNALLATPDASIYKRDHIKAILVTSYRHQRPVVAFSAAFVNAGALAALYSTPAQIARQTADIIASNGASLPPPLSPNLFSIAINQNVAQALDLILPDEAAIRRALLAEREAR